MAARKTAAVPDDDIDTSGQKPGNWAVIDSLATSGPRTHDAAPGLSYQLHATKKTWMPQSHAMAFLCDAAFKVYDDAGELVHALPPITAQRGGHEAPKLRPGETIANLDELNTVALLARAKLHPDGRKFHGRTPRTELIEFLASPPKRGRGDGAGGTAEPEADDIEDMSPDALDRVLGPKKSLEEAFEGA